MRRRIVLQAAIFAASLHTIPAAAGPPVVVPTTLDEFGSVTAPALFGEQLLTAVIDTGSAICSIPLTQAAILLAEGRATRGPNMQSTLADGRHTDMRTIYVQHVRLGSVTVDHVLTAVAPDGSVALIGENWLFAFPRFAFERGQLQLTR